MSKRTFRATVRFAPIQSIATNRKELARQLHSEMLKLKNVAAGSKEVTRRVVAEAKTGTANQPEGTA